MNDELIIKFSGRSSNQGSSILESNELSAYGFQSAGGVLHALTCPLDRVLWADEVELARSDLYDFCLVRVSPDDPSEPLENKHLSSEAKLMSLFSMQGSINVECGDLG